MREVVVRGELVVLKRDSCRIVRVARRLCAVLDDMQHLLHAILALACRLSQGGAGKHVPLVFR
jgi:hypothetical protein